MFINVAVSTESTKCQILLSTDLRLLLTTGGTAVWFFPKVASLVLQKFSVRVERLSTLVTGERLVRGMSPLMLLQIAQVVESWAMNKRQHKRVRHKYLEHKLHVSRLSILHYFLR